MPGLFLREIPLLFTKSPQTEHAVQTIGACGDCAVLSNSQPRRKLLLLRTNPFPAVVNRNLLTGVINCLVGIQIEAVEPPAIYILHIAILDCHLFSTTFSKACEPSVPSSEDLPDALVPQTIQSWSRSSEKSGPKRLMTMILSLRAKKRYSNSKFGIYDRRDTKCYAD